MSPRSAALLVLLGAFGCTSATPEERGMAAGAALDIPAARVAPAEAAGHYRAAGTVRAARRAELSTRLMGRVESIRVRADIVGDPAEGYNVAWVEVDPAYVWLTGDRREVLGMREAITEPIEIRGQRESIDREVRLALPDHVWMEEARPLKVRVQVDEIPKRTGRAKR